MFTSRRTVTSKTRLNNGSGVFPVRHLRLVGSGLCVYVTIIRADLHVDRFPLTVRTRKCRKAFSLRLPLGLAGSHGLRSACMAYFCESPTGTKSEPRIFRFTQWPLHTGSSQIRQTFLKGRPLVKTSWTDKNPK